MDIDAARALSQGHWLVKSEPAAYAWADLQRDGRTAWTGVRNNQAAIYLKAMRVGDEVLYYHSNQGLEIVGVARVAAPAYSDPTDPTGRFVAVDLAPLRALAHPVSLARMKASPDLAQMQMFRQFRLSVIPVSPPEWAEIMRLAETA